MKKISIVIGTVVVLLIGIAYLSLTAQNVVVMGVLGDYTRSDTTGSVDAFRAVELAVSELNVETITYEIVRLNIIDYTDLNSLEKDVEKYNIDMIVGPSTSSQFFAMKELLEEVNLPVFLIAVSTDEIYDKKDNLFRLTDTLQLQVESLLTACNTYIGLQNIQVFYTEKNAAFSKVFAVDFSNVINSSGGEAMYYEVGDLGDDSVQQALLQDYDANGFVIIAGPGDAGIIAGLLSKNNPDVPMLLPAWAKSDRTKEYTVDVENDIYILSTAQPIRAEGYNTFEKKLNESNGLSVTSFSYFGYEIVYFIDHVMKKTSSKDLTKMQDYIHEIQYYKGNFNDFTFNHSGDGGRGYSLMMIDNNDFILIDNLLE